MSETTTPNGRVVWHDLMSTDPAGAAAFYRTLFGWETRPLPLEGFDPYQMIHVGDAGIGGIVPLDPQQGVPSHWIGYVTVEDVDAATKRAQESGAETRVPPSDIPNIGRFAVIQDPSGAVIAPFHSASGADTEPEALQAGMFCWDELLTRDPEGCAAFYSHVFEWNRETMAMPEGAYHLFKRSDRKDAAGMMQMPPGAQAPSHWLPYVLVEDVDAKTEQARGLGSQVWVEPRDIPNIGRFSVLSDPTGASFALFKGAQTQG